MWFIRAENNWYYYTDKGRAYLTNDARCAEAFGPIDIERHRQFVIDNVTPGKTVELVECSSRKILTPAMLKTLNLENV